MTAWAVANQGVPGQMSRLRSSAFLTAWLLAVPLAACGGGPVVRTPVTVPPAATLTAQMNRAVAAATSVHVSGRRTAGATAVRLDIGVLRSGEMSGTITQNGVPVELAVIGAKAYVKATPAFIRALHLPASVCTAICGKYVAMPVSRLPLARAFSMSNLTGPLAAGTPRLSAAGQAVVGGTRVYVLRSPQGDRIDVAQSPPHYPVAVVLSGGRGTLTFTRWSNVPAPSAPPRSQTVSTGSLG